MDEAEFLRVILTNPVNRVLLARLPETGLNDAWLVSGGLFQTCWNHRTGRAPGHGIKDYDIFYFDGSDLSWEAEDAAIRHAMQVLGDVDAAIEIRNQARVHLWYEQKFGIPYNPLTCVPDGIDRFLAVACMYGVRQDAEGRFVAYAPKGFGDLEQMVIRPNMRAHFDTRSYRAKAARWCRTWPELRFQDVA